MTQALPTRLCHTLRLEPLQDGRFAIILPPEVIQVMGVRRVEEPLVLEVVKGLLTIERTEGDPLPEHELRSIMVRLEKDYGEAFKRLAES